MYTVLLIAMSMLVLLTNYDYLEVSGIVGSIFGVSISGIEIKDSNLPTIAKVTVLLSLVYAHIRINGEMAVQHFNMGYRYHNAVRSEVAERISKEVGDNRYDAMVGNIKPSILSRKYEFGQYTREDGSLTKPITVTLKIFTHVIACSKGGIKIMKFRIVRFSGPIILAAWAICTIPI